MRAELGRVLTTVGAVDERSQRTEASVFTLLPLVMGAGERVEAAPGERTEFPIAEPEFKAGEGPEVRPG